MLRRAGPSAGGESWLWLGAAAVTVSLVAVLLVLLLIATRGLEHFWPAPLDALVIEAADGSELRLLGAIVDEERVPTDTLTAAGPAGDTQQRLLLHKANRDLGGPDFRWVDARAIRNVSRPRDAVVLERVAWGRAQGYLVDRRLSEEDDDARASEEDDDVGASAPSWARLQSALRRADEGRREIDRLRRTVLAPADRNLTRLGQDRPGGRPPSDRERSEARESAADARARLAALQSALARDSVVLELADGSRHEIALQDVLRAWRPNRMDTLDRLGFALAEGRRFLTEAPREANTEGGVAPAIFGTVLLVLLMALLVTPLGVLAAIYLHEYAPGGPGVRLLRIAVSNLAAVPSIVYGVFGLGFFVYLAGGSVDALLYSDTLPAPTFGAPGLLWAALTLALLTLPVVVVSTEEGLARIPRDLRDGSLALGATRSETLTRIVLPAALPAILTGVILAVARAAGEVAPLMLVGVVKLAPSLPVDGSFPFLHLDRQFMHLGFHVYDLGFQSPNVEAARPLLFATALLLVLLISALNLSAVLLRSRLDARYGPADL